MKRPMLRLHNPHLKNKVHGHSSFMARTGVDKRSCSVQSWFCKDIFGMCYHLCISGRQRWIW
ncbi:unnamed protein product [Brassica rapa subsp. trilocularis]